MKSVGRYVRRDVVGRLGGAACLALTLVRLGAGCSSNQAAMNDAGSGDGGAPATDASLDRPVGTGGGSGVGGAGAGGSAGADAGARLDASPSDGAVDAAAATLTQVWSVVLNECSSGASPCCVGCHDGSLLGLPNYNTTATAFATLVGVPSVSCACSRVTPGNAEASVIVNKLRAGSGLGLAVVCGGQPMPIGGRITLEQLHLIEAWINAGALDD